MIGCYVSTKMLLSPLTRFASVLHAQIAHSFTYFLRCRLLSFLIIIFPLTFAFVWCWFLFYSCCNHQISDAIFCYCFISAFSGMLCHSSCAFLCLLAWLFFCFLLLYMYLRACPIFCNGFILCLIVFFSQLHTFAFSCFYAGSCRCHFLDLDNFLSTHFAFCCFLRWSMVVTLLSAFSFA